MRVAYFSPMPPERTGVADYSALLVPALGEKVELTVARRGSKRVPRGTDVALYHVGNNPEAHAWIVDALRRRPEVGRRLAGTSPGPGAPDSTGRRGPAQGPTPARSGPLRRACR